jgi:hypothetical protein
VIALIGAGLAVEEVAHNITNPATGRAISHMTLRRAFRDELATGSARIQGVRRGAVRAACPVPR